MNHMNPYESNEHVLTTILNQSVAEGSPPFNLSCGLAPFPREVHMAPFLADKKEPRVAARWIFESPGLDQGWYMTSITYGLTRGI